MTITHHDADATTTSRRTVVVGLVVDEGVPAEVAAHLAEELPGRLARELSDRVEWRVEVEYDPLRLDEEGRIPMLDLADAYRARHQWDVVVLITDLPRRVGTQPIVSDYSTSHRVALASLPALGGGFRLGARLRRLVVHLIGHLTEDQLGFDVHRHHVPNGWFISRLADLLVPVEHIDSSDDGIDQHMALSGIRGRLRLLRGLVYDNRPWRLVPHLTSATAAAAATAAFGIFYSSIWGMAHALPIWRLALINVVAIAAMVVWLIAYNDLWDRPARRADRGKTVLYNASTVLTLSIGVASMYAMLYVLALLTAAAVIDAGYLQAQLDLHRPAGVGDYARLVWLACSMGVVAGALGSSLDSEEAVRYATYSRRERERQARQRRPHEDRQNPRQRRNSLPAGRPSR